MQFTPKNVKKFQQGGEIAPADQNAAPVAETPADGAGQDPMMILGEAAAQALQAQDCQIAMQVCQGLLELLQQVSGGAPQEAPGEPVYAKNGGRLLRRIKK